MNMTEQHTMAPATQRYAFLVHSADTLTNNLPPEVDNKPLARQRRRRTSPEDQAILEAEYRKDPKPDKAARMGIVARVALGEKEVQIWFQNRRQSARRKSRPLLPHEVAHYQQTNGLLPDGFTSVEDHGQDTSMDVSMDISEPDMSITNPGQVKEVQMPSTMTRPSVDAVVPGTKPTTRSSIRLSMGADGTAVITTSDSPSPPRRRPSNDQQESSTSTPNTSFKSCLGSPRRYSGRARDSRAWEFFVDKDSRDELQEHAKQEASGSAAGAIGLMRSNSGRRAQTQTPLLKRGSLSRQMSTSSKRTIQTNKTPLLQRSQSLQNQLATSYTGSPGGNGNGNGMKRGPRKSSSPRKSTKVASSGLGIHLVSLSADSDKENWSPERVVTDGGSGSGRVTDSASRTVVPSAVRLQPTPRTDTPLWSTRHRTPRATRMSTSPAQGHVHVPMGGDGDDDDDNDDEVAYFMRGGDKENRERKSQSASGEEDLDCVQGLLSLSQGNWK